MRRAAGRGIGETVPGTLEIFFNRQNDWDWGWGPMLFLRPPQDGRMGARQVVWYFLPSTIVAGPCGLLVSAFGMVYFPAVYHISRRPGMPPSPSEVIAVTRYLMALPVFQVVLFVATALMIVYWIGTIWAWNRRADRLRTEERAPEDAAEPGDWPPAPRAI